MATAISGTEVPTVPISAQVIEDYTFENVEGQDQSKQISYDDLYTWFNKSPEVNGITSAICDDILGDSIEFVGSASAVKKAEEFSKTNYFKKNLYSALQDYVLTGDGYLGKKLMTQKMAADKLGKISKGLGLEMSDSELMTKISKRDPSIFEPRNLFVLKSNTIKIDYDPHGNVNYYVQKVNGNAKIVRFITEEVVHFALNNLGGDVYGNTPWYSALNEIASIWYIKDYAGVFFQNDATPDMVWNLKDTAPNSPEYKKFVQKLREFKKSKNKHKFLVTTGETSYDKINDFTKDMEFSNLLDKLTDRLLMVWDMPRSRLGSLGKDLKGSRESSSGYYKKINRLQGEIEALLNNELWKLFGNVEMKFRRAYKRDESIEADIVAKLAGQPVITPNEGRTYLGMVPKEDDEAMDEVKGNFEQQPGGKPNEAKDEDETGNQHQTSQDKKKLAKRGTIFEIRSFDHFKAIVEVRQPWMNAKVMSEESEDFIKFYYADAVGTYSVEVPKELINESFADTYIVSTIPAKVKPTTIIVE